MPPNPARLAASAWNQTASQSNMKLQAVQAQELAVAMQKVADAFERSKNAVMGWATAGLAGTTMGERLHFQTQLLRMEITQLFLPAIEKVSEWIQKLTNRMRELTGEQQNNLGRWLATGAALLGSIVLMPRLLAGIEGLKTSWAALRVVMALNPFAAIGAGVALLMAQTEEGREALSEIGSSLLDTFLSIAETIGSVLLPVLEFLADFLSSGVGKVIIFAAVFTAAFKLMAASVFPLVASLYSLVGVLGIAAIALAVFAIAKSKSAKTEFEQSTEQLAKGVRSGRQTKEQGLEEVKKRAQEEGLAAEEAYRQSFEGQLERAQFGKEVFEAMAKARGEQTRQTQQAFGEAAIERAAKGAKDRNQLLLAQAGQEDPRQTIQRIQTAALRADPGKETAENTKAGADAAQKILEWLRGFGLGKPDNQEKPPKGD